MGGWRHKTILSNVSESVQNKALSTLASFSNLATQPPSESTFFAGLQLLLGVLYQF